MITSSNTEYRNHNIKDINNGYYMIGGDLNVDFYRSGYNKRILLDFINDFNLFTCIDLPYVTVPFTYINHNNSTSKIDHFFSYGFIKR